MTVGEALLTIVPLLAVALVLLTRAFAEVSRVRIERFARRQRLVITPGNAPFVIGYLATTRRWRGVGLVAAVVAVAEYWQLTSNWLRFDVVAAFVGWFIGATVADWRIGTSRTDTAKRRATLVPRQLTRYVPTSGRVVAGLAVTLLLVVTVLAAINAVDGSRRGRLVAQLAVCVLIAAAVLAAGRRVLRRPQPSGPPDLVAADEAVRGRSLCVLTGSTIAIAGYLTAWLSASLESTDVVVFANGAARPVIAIGGLVLPLLGAMTAFAIARHPKQPAPVDAAAVGGAR
ncbi:MAG TPA: hypothetical protein VE442_05170 [Jatrophihabitans sp.]|nr:hypothetical protein [Jatrophihabitans sp.]